MSTPDRASEPGYGKPNADYFASILQRNEPGEPMWALNFMKYRERAQYADGRETTLSGLEADNEYAPIEPLTAVGARPVFIGDVIHQIAGDETRWDRIGVVRYPTRRAIIEMSLREDFQAKHVHKEAGMERTIVVACFPEEVTDGPGGEKDLILLQLVADTSAPDLAHDIASTRIARFSVEDVLIGDGRRFAEARYDRISPDVSEELSVRPQISDRGMYAVLVAPFINDLVASTST